MCHPHSLSRSVVSKTGCNRTDPSTFGKELETDFIFSFILLKCLVFVYFSIMYLIYYISMRVHVNYKEIYICWGTRHRFFIDRGV